MMKMKDDDGGDGEEVGIERRGVNFPIREVEV